jgi:hypothetical protein
MKNPALRERLLSQAANPIGSSSQEYAEFLRKEREKWSAVIKKINLKL